MINTPILIFVLLLFAFVLYFFCRLFERQIKELLRAKARSARNQNRRFKLTINRLEQRISVLENFKPGEPMSKTFSTPNLFEKSEQRHATELKETVSINGVPVKKQS